MDFKHFRYFVTVAEELHVGRSAEKLRMAQPALSQQIQQLELQLGVLLFSREKRRLALTPAGSLFLNEARLALRQAEHAAQVARRFEKGEIGEIRIGYVDSAMLGVATRSMLSRYKGSHPDVQLVLHGRNVADQVAGLQNGDLDACVVRGPLPPASSKFCCDLIEHEELVVCLSFEHRLAGRGQIAAAELRDDSFVLPFDPPGVGLGGQIALICQQAGFTPKVGQYAGQTTTMACLVASELGVAILPAALQQLDLGGVVYLPLTPRVATPLYLLSRSDNRSAALLSFIDTCRTMAPGAAPELQQVLELSHA